MVASVKIIVLTGKSKHSVLKGAFSECLFVCLSRNNSEEMRQMHKMISCC